MYNYCSGFICSAESEFFLIFKFEVCYWNTTNSTTALFMLSDSMVPWLMFWGF